MYWSADAEGRRFRTQAGASLELSQKAFTSA
jgi:hypothetical protein